MFEYMVHYITDYGVWGDSIITADSEVEARQLFREYSFDLITRIEKL